MKILLLTSKPSWRGPEVHRHDLISVVQELFDDIRADESVSAGNDSLHLENLRANCSI
jgi:hypothetical protein